MDDYNQAVVLYIGWEIASFPQEDEARVLDRFGPTLGPALVVRVQALLEELQAIQPNWDQHTLVSASNWAVKQLKQKHPQLDEAATSALEWIYSWWWK
ncbi:hypothetical protein Q4610_20960 [Sphingobium sp. HBC34]|uniref:Uncharacterized protein n=1 Tax=Sphingobium cyanobacteriorum TaxID=3063954 RepID=A0ABT8ZSK1_9SPHN|nr:hypothetical protein [Sphingobium sp. HBC34]MDO7837514.1 hypothetical protein [Sphingobium sp. HBC34]